MAHEPVKLTCKFCKKQFTTAYKNRNKRKFCDNNCYRSSLKGEGNPAHGKTYRSKKTHPEWAEKIAKTSQKTRGDLMRSDQNPMKNPEIAARMSITRKKMLKENHSLRKLMSEQRIQP